MNMNNTLNIEQRVEKFLRDDLAERLAQCSESQRSLFAQIFPGTVPTDLLKSAIALCDRTIRKNAADPSRPRTPDL